MVKDILNEIGIPHKMVRFLQPPKEPFIVYFDDILFRGADHYVAIEEHTVRFELYSETLQPTLERKIEQVLIDRHISFDKSERIWLEEDQTYMVAFYFEYTTKREEQ